MSMIGELTDLVGEAFADLGLDRGYGTVVVSQRPDLAQFQCNGALAAAKTGRRPPRDIASDIAVAIGQDPRVAAVEVAGPGFVNLSVTDAHLANTLTRTSSDDRLGLHLVTNPRSVIVDYAGPNVAKDLHVGHLRPSLIGESLKRIYSAVGHDVKGDVHLGDWGLPMGQLIAALEECHPHWPYFDSNSTAEGDAEFPTESPLDIEDLQELYPKASQRFNEDTDFRSRAHAATVALQEGHAGYRALWAHFRSVSVDAFRSTFDRLGVRFELWLGEASVGDRVKPLAEELRASGVAVESDGALVIQVSEDEDSVDIPPLMLLNSRGGATYATTDLATLAQRVDDLGADEIVYVVDLRQSLHFTQLFRAARLAGVASADVTLSHAGFGTVDGPDGRPFRTRNGDLPRLAHLVDEVVELAARRLDENDLATDFSATERQEIARLVGLAALKYGELSNHRTTNYRFDLERFTMLQGRTGPYLLYVVVRTSSILARLSAEGIEPGPFTVATHEKERLLALTLLQWPEVVERSLQAHTPNTIAEYAYELSGVFNQFYDACHILSANDPATQRSWLALVALTRRLLVAALDLLVIDVPLRM
ncbi:MAG: arginine--tRNA ligase [Actinomycetia bacterium]|nr:arginine--tRNA ligase [Actinomycetes bacterium]